MASIGQAITTEISDNWPAFVYIALTVGFSFSFLRERRAETRALREMGEDLRNGVQARLDRIEILLAQGKDPAASAEDVDFQLRAAAERHSNIETRSVH